MFITTGICLGDSRDAWLVVRGPWLVKTRTVPVLNENENRPRFEKKEYWGRFSAFFF